MTARHPIHTPLQTMALMTLWCLASLSALPRQARAAVTGAHTWADHSALAEGRWVKIALDGTDDGVYQITYAQLRSMGFATPAHVGVYGYGGNMLGEALSGGHIDDLPEVATCNDSAQQRILFYSQGLVQCTYSDRQGYYTHRQNPYATSVTYFLHEKEEPSRALDTLSVGASADETASTYDVYLMHEVESTNVGHTGRNFYGESFLYTQTQDFRFDTLNAGQVRVMVNFIACTESAPSTVKVSLDGTLLQTATLLPRSSDYTYATEVTVNRIATSTVTAGSTVRITYTPGVDAPSLANLNYISLQGQRNLTIPGARQSCLLFRNARAASRRLCYQFAGSPEAGSRLQLWDVSTPHVPRLQPASSQSPLTFIPEASGLREYALVNLDGTSFGGIKVVGEVANQDLHGLPQTEMVIVTSSAFRQQAEQLAAYRRTHDGLHVEVVTSEQVYNEYASGKPDATAIRLLMKQFYDRYHAALQAGDMSALQPRYLLLYGDGHYNNRAHAASPYFLPTYQLDQSLVGTASCTCDDYYGFLDDDEGGRTNSLGQYLISSDVLDIGIGRLPVHSLTEAQNVLAKIIAYSDNTYYGAWKNRLVFLSDDDKIQDRNSDSPNLHMKHNDALVDSLLSMGHREFIYRKIYLPAYNQTTSASGTDYPDAKKEFYELMQQGVLLINYAGHGNTSSITHEGLMTTTRASELRMRYLPVWVTASCDVSRYDEDETSMGETLLLNPNGGAAALFSTTRVVFAQQNLKLNEALISNIFDRNPDGSRYRLGDIMRAAKISLGSDYNKLNFCLLGDPSAKLAFPEQEMELTAVDGRPVDDGSLFTLPALSRVTMRGRVLKTGTAETDTTFNGLVYPTIYDAEESIVANKGLYQDPVYTFQTRTRKVFTGRDAVRRGEFEFSFVVPEDVSYSAETGLVNLYTCSDRGAEGQGYFSRFVITDGATALDADTVPPVVTQLFLDAPSWSDGDAVGATPYFYVEVADSSGINATGNSIGHDITLTLHSLTDPLMADVQYILNDYFKTYTGRPTTGSIGYSLPELADGDYVGTFRIWDTFNNPTTVTFRFTVDAALAPVSVVVQAYPSPCKAGEEVTFRILHNRPASADALHLQVYTQLGQLVHEATAVTSAADIVYLKPDAADVTDLSTALNADEQSRFYGQSVIGWQADVPPGLYVYRVYLQSAGSDTASRTKKLIIR